jgi:putative oxidoreductase
LIWPAHVPEGLVRFIGAAEAAGALGLVLPLFMPLPAYLMRWAAFGLSTVMVCALGYHIMLFQGGMLISTGVLDALAVDVGVRRK